jgi:ammonium transporter Rh
MIVTIISDEKLKKLRRSFLFIRKFRWLFIPALFLVLFLAGTQVVWAADNPVLEIQTYDRAIQIMAMLLVGFGFLMVFLKRYGRSALTATFLLVSAAIPLYMLLDSGGIMGSATNSDINRLVLGEFGAASLLICAGACLGRLKMYQYLILAVLFIPCYMLNQWIILDNGFGLIKSGLFVDTGGSIIIHAFGALFGMGLVIAMTYKKEAQAPIESDYTSDKFSMLGSMVLWVFWPSFCAALVAPESVIFTSVNVVIALCGSTLSTYFATVSLRRKICISDIANASLAGGVAIGATCATANHPTAFLIGILAGVLSTYGFAIIQPRIEKAFRMIDTCGVTNLHGWPGLMGGLAAVFIVQGLNIGVQFLGIGITIVLALIPGYIVGKIILASGRVKNQYEDSVEIIEVNQEININPEVSINQK